ncbi:hypothetical protein CQW23_03538 [Capsicum baccatum]|uniref:Uncharacterized protein n=1 Tax=Capsicum baccatum TaxID=33114 RepID=A0A2G2XC19_CAPBA|nr:hypothetical protein CQW23_03538 [Capsicum baccatum]
MLWSLPGTLSILFDNFLKTKFYENFCTPTMCRWLQTALMCLRELLHSSLLLHTWEQQFNEEEIQVVSYPNNLFTDMKSKPLSDASVPNMDVVINALVSGGINLMPSSLSQVDTSIFQQLPEEFLVKLKYELLCNSKIAIIQLGFCILTLTKLRCRLLDTPNEQL